MTTATAPVRALPRVVAMSIAILVLAGCALVPGLGNLGGREVCWEDGIALQAMTVEGVLDVDAAGARLALADGRFLEVGFAKYGMGVPADGPGRVEAEDGRVVAIAGERVRLFGGLTSDGRLFHACEVDARQAPDA